MIFRILLLFLLISINTCVLALQKEDSTKELSPRELLSILPDDKLLGDPKAPILMLEYASLTCHHCSLFHEKVFPEITKKYIDTGKVLYIFRHFPLDYRALKAAMLSHCYAEDYFNFNKAVFSAINSWNYYNLSDLTLLQKVITLGNLKQDLYSKCIDDKSIMNKVIKGKSDAINKLGITATPVFFIKLNDGSYVNPNQIKHEGYKKQEYFADIIDKLYQQVEIAKDNKNPNYELGSKERHRNRGL